MAIAVVIRVIIFNPIPPFIISLTVMVEAPKTIALGAVATYQIKIESGLLFTK